MGARRSRARLESNQRSISNLHHSPRSVTGPIVEAYASSGCGSWPHSCFRYEVTRRFTTVSPVMPPVLLFVRPGGQQPANLRLFLAHSLAEITDVLVPLLHVDGGEVRYDQRKLLGCEIGAFGESYRA